MKFISGKILRTALAVLLATPFSLAMLPGIANAEGPYIGANYSRFEYRDKDIDEDELIRPDGVTLRVGLEAERWLGLEIRGATGVDADKRDFAGGSVEFDLDELYGAYAKLGVPLTETVQPYLIGGYTKATGSAKVTSLGLSRRETSNIEDESLGAGMSFNLSDSVALNLEYMRYIDKGSQELSAASIGLRSAF